MKEDMNHHLNQFYTKEDMNHHLNQFYTKEELNQNINLEIMILMRTIKIMVKRKKKRNTYL